jgi:hypothetical protein
MNTKEMLPISYVKKFTPLVEGDVLFYNDGGYEFTLNNDKQVALYNDKDADKYYSLFSFAGRPNTGTQPVGDDVEVDRNWNPHYSMKAKDVNWVIGSASLRGQGVTDETWKPNHAAMLKQWQAEQAKGATWNVKESHVPHGCVPSDLEMPDPSVNESSDGSRIGNIGNILHNMSCSMVGENEQNEFGGYASFCWELGVKLKERTSAVRAEPPTFTQAQCDAGELPAVGAECIFSWTDCELLNGLEIGDTIKVIAHFDNNGTKIAVFTHECDDSNGQGEGVFVCMGGPRAFKPIQTAEEKLRNHLWDSINCEAKSDSLTDVIIHDLMNSDKFTITLKD